MLAPLRSHPTRRARRPTGLILPRAGIAVGLLLCLLAVGACSGNKKRAKPPRPPAAKAVVTTGVIVQLRLAVEAFDTVFDMRAEEQDLLPMLVHAWATFYGWTDPSSDTRARYRFTEQLCRARLPGLKGPRDLFRCMDGLRVALLEDLIWATQRHLKRGHPDKVGPYSLSRLIKEIRARLKTLKQTLTLRQQRRSRRQLYTAKRCRLHQPVAPVLGLAARELSLNGFPVITQVDRAFEKFADHELEGLRHQLESRLMESQPAGKQPEQLILAVDRRVTGRPLLHLIGLASGLGVSRVCLKVTQVGGFTAPCCLSVRLSPKVVRPRPALELDGAGLHRVTDAGRVTVAPGPGNVLKAFGALGAHKTPPPLVILPGARPKRLYAILQALQGTAVMELIPAGIPLSPPRTVVPDPTGDQAPGATPGDGMPPRTTTRPTPAKPKRPGPRR